MPRKSPKVPTLADKEVIRSLRSSGKELQEICEITGFSYGTVQKHCGDIKPRHGEAEGTKVGWSIDGDNATYTGITDSPIKSEADAIKASNIDLTVWYVEKCEYGYHTVGMKLKETSFDDKGRKQSRTRPVQTQQYIVRLKLKRLFTKSIQQAHQALFERMAKIAPSFPPIYKQAAKVKGDYLAVMGLFDVHFGKHCWGKETGKDYDVDIAVKIFDNAVSDMMESVRSKKIGRWLVPIGNDYFHMDNSRNTTYAGTPQDVDGRYAKVIEAGSMGFVNAIKRMAQTAPVDVVLVQGNHDPTTSYHLAHFTWAYFHLCDSVNVDYGPSPRKYYSWGANLIGLTHGNEEKIHELPNLMASEKPEEWLDSRKGSREWLIGHWHQSKKWVTKTTDTSQETVIRALRSLSGTDAWHHRKGYIGTHQAAEVYLYDKVSGYSGHNVVYARVKA